ncbi:MAG: YihY family inner membrane protein [Elusimicrobia bacterium]|nr:YihY family inner membrane protein [Elusimicrobiota bacterium]
MDFLERLERWVEGYAWGPAAERPDWIARFCVGCVRLAFILWRKFNSDQVTLRASALTYTTLLALVPCLAVIFAVLKGLGVPSLIEARVLENVAVGSQDLVIRILQYIQQTNVTTLGYLGLGGLALTLVATLTTVEAAFNAIWGVTQVRHWLRRWIDYLSVVIVAPLFLLAALSVTTSLQVRAVAAVETIERWGVVGQWLKYGLGRFPTISQLAPYVIIWMLFAFVYLFLPNTRIRPASAAFGGVIGGTLWQLAQWWYIRFQSNLTQANAIYGAMAQLPLLLGWIYLSWVVVLLGAEAAFAHQHRQSYYPLAGTLAGADLRERTALRAMLAIGQRFREGEPPWTVHAIAQRLSLPTMFVHNVLEALASQGLLVLTDDQRLSYLPAKDLSRIQAFEILRGAHGREATAGDGEGRAPEEAMVHEVLQRKQAALQQTLGPMTLRDLLARLPSR